MCLLLYREREGEKERRREGGRREKEGERGGRDRRTEGERGRGML